MYQASSKLFSSIIACGLLVCFAQSGQAQWVEGRYGKLFEQVKKTFGEPKGMVRLDPTSRVWVDKKGRKVVADGYIALKEGPLEMFACLPGTKEHESIVAAFTKAQLVHAGLLAVGAKTGTPAQWEPEYQPPTGSEIRVIVLWKDKDGKKRAADARNWIRESLTEDKTLTTNFVFSGSEFWVDPSTNEKVYQAEAGDFICVANFSTAMLDVPIKSHKVNQLLTFEAFTERIPEPGTPVRLVLEFIESETSNANKKKEGALNSAESSTGKPKIQVKLAGYERLLDEPPSQKPESEEDSSTESVNSEEAENKLP